MKQILAFFALFLLLAALSLSGLFLAFAQAADDCALTWDANDPKDGVVEYRVYAKPQGTLAWTLRWEGAETETTCADFVRPIEYEGPWEFVVTALDQSDNESGLSDLVTKTWPVKLPAPDLIVPLSGVTVLPGMSPWEWTKVPGAIAYDLFVHQDGTPYPDEALDACEKMAHCGKVMGTKTLVDLAPSSRYDFWIVPIGMNGERGKSRGGAVLVGAVPPPPDPPDPPPVPIPDPPKLTLHRALQSAVEWCVKNKSRTILRCFQQLSDALKEVQP